jgi:formyltetrahydrofolate deformylase
MKSILLVSCPDQKGIVHAVTSAVLLAEGNVINLEQHVDRQDQAFFMRVEWEGPEVDFKKIFTPTAEKFKMQWEYFLEKEKPRMALFVSKLDHCLVDILHRVEAGSLGVQVPLVISNFKELEGKVKHYGVPFFHCETEGEIQKLLAEHSINFIGLARYMKVLSPEFVKVWPHQIINVHHSFLPAFIGARPYHEAHEKGVKLIGATSHYVNELLDDGPIIQQAVRPAGHRFSVEDLIEIGKDIEREVFYRALKKHTEHKIIVHKNRTVIFH